MSNLIPVSRKEQYLSKIDGMTNKSPDKTYTKEEYFFSEILGEALHKPVLETRYEMYLAKIAGREIGIPYPETRLERFLAKAAGMNISVPTPITREEMYWSTYSPFYLSNASGEPPLSYNSVTGTLNNYRIYGQTSRNLFNETIYNKNVEDNTPIYVPIYVGNVDYVTCSTTCPKTITGGLDSANSRYIFILSGNVNTGAQNAVNGVSYGAPRTIQPSNGYVTITYRKIESTNVRPWEYQTMLNEGSAVLPYEPYGESVGDLVTSGEHAGEYKAPVTVGGNLFDITNYLNSITSCLHGTWSHSSNNFTINATASDAYLIPFSGNDAYKIAVFPNTPYTISFDLSNSIDDAPCNIIVAENGSLEGGYMHQIGVAQKAKYTLTTRYDTEFVTLRFALSRAHTSQTFSHIMFNEGSTALPYETYQPPVTTTIYLPEQIRKVGNEAEYIDYGEQKMHRVRKNLFYITKFTNNSTQLTAQGVNFSIIDNEVYANGTSTGMYPQAMGFDYVLTEGETYAATLYIEGEYTGLPYIYCTTTYDSAGNYQKVPPNVRTIFTALPDTRILFVAQGTGESFNIKYKLLITKATIEDDTYEPYIENTDLDVTLPALPTIKGTNVLSVGTAVQPSKVYVKYKGERQ